MDCKTFEKLIPDFLDDTLDNRTVKEFLRHYDSCSSCREELSIQYLVREGLPKLETGETFHLKNELTQTMDNARMTNIRRRKLTYYAYSYEIVTFVTIAAFFIIMAVYF